MVQLKVRMLLCGTGNKRQKSKYMTSLAPGSSDKVLSYNLAQGFYGFASTHWDKKKKKKNELPLNHCSLLVCWSQVMEN